ncbi:MAG: hypothetical protein AMJ91_07130 [candidate division Zixibacteria bacterium SM23_73_3]|nr:MAG: hypothetical protein AMJ91_07130 [candidate division Zixibacteria bacterium SM23_73_3]
MAVEKTDDLTLCVPPLHLVERGIQRDRYKEYIHEMVISDRKAFYISPFCFFFSSSASLVRNRQEHPVPFSE